MPEPHPTAGPSYRALFGVPALARVLLSMQIARIAQSMISIVMILFALQRYDDPSLAGLVAFASIFPGMIVSPIAGALLDRHGRVRLIILDYVVVAIALSTLATLSLGHDLPAWLLVAITSVSSLTGPLSSSGLRSLFPLLVPKALWERVNAMDSNGWVLATVVGAPMGAVIAQVVGFEPAMLAIAAAYVVAAVVIFGAPDPRTAVTSTGNLFRDAWLGLVYTWNNETLRALAVSLSIMNLSGGAIEIIVPVLVLKHLGMGQDVVGLMFGLMGAAGVVSAFLSGRIQTEGRERFMLVAPGFGFIVATAALLLPGGLLPIVFYMVLSGLLNGPVDIALFTLRQRRTDPAWMGRAFTVSMNLNFSGFPIGAAVAGAMLSFWPVEWVVWFAVAANVAGALLAYAMIPRGEPEIQTAASPEPASPEPPSPEPA
jgi:MFS family permease